VPIALEPWGTVFVVFRAPAAAPSRALAVADERVVATVPGPWTVTFQADRGAPPSLTMSRLSSWSDSADPGVKYFSGTAAYTATVQVPDTDSDGVWIDLGSVKNLAEVLVNGTSLGVAWKPPFRVDGTHAVHAGANTLEVRVTNLWVNRMIGDRQPGATTPYTFTRPVFYTASSPLVPSGLLGPVRVLRVSGPHR
jgi:hypothetical protein